MARPPSEQPTDGEMEILNILWDRGPSELGRIRQAMQETRPVASSTVATMLKLMEGKGLVERQEGTRGALWAAKVDRTSTRTRLIAKLLNLAFESSAPRLFAHMLESGDLGKTDVETLRKLLDEHDSRRPRRPKS